MSSIISLIPVILPILSWLLERFGASNETKKKYYSMLQQIIDDETASARLRNQAMSQRERILQRIKDQQNGNG